MRLRRLCAAAAAAFLLGAAAPAAARSLTVDDLLGAETLGAVRFDPSGRWLLVERRERYDSAETFDYNTETALSLSRLEVLNLDGAVELKPLAPCGLGRGVVIGEFSPSGRYVTVNRLKDRRWSLGVVELATQKVRWFYELTPQEAGGGRTLQWISDDAFLVIARTDGLPPFWMRLGWLTSQRLTQAWAAAAAGRGAHSVQGSGRFAAVRARAPANRLLRVDVTTGDAIELARGDVFDMELSPDRRRLALFAAGKDVQARAAGPVRGQQGLETEATALFILDLQTGRTRPICPECDFLPQLLTWSPNGQSLLGATRGADGLWTSGAIVAVDVATGALRDLTTVIRPRTRLNPVRVWAMWLGDEPIILARDATDSAGRFDWIRVGPGNPRRLTTGLPEPDSALPWSDGARLWVSAGGALWRVDRDGRDVAYAPRATAMTPLSRGGARGARLEQAPKRELLVRFPQASRSRLGLLQPLGLRALPSAPKEHSVLDVSSARRAVVSREVTPQGVTRLWLHRSGRARVVVLTLNSGWGDTVVPEAHPIRHKGPDGQTLTSWLFLPTPARGAPPPLIVRPYLGDNHTSPPRDPPGQSGFLQNIRILTGRGYAVLVPSLPKPAAGLIEPADGLAARLLDVVDAAARDPKLAGRFDPDRLALMGFSFGGYTVMTAITQTDRFRAAVAMHGISDLTSYWSSLGPSAHLNPEEGYVSNWHTGAVESTQPTLLAPPWRVPDRYVRNSPLYAADRVRTPLLLIHGGLDSVPLAQSEAMFSALFRQGKDAELVTYWGALHGLTSPGDVRDVYRRTFEFLDGELAVRPASDRLAASPGPAFASSEPNPPRPRPTGRPSASRPK